MHHHAAMKCTHVSDESNAWCEITLLDSTAFRSSPFSYDATRTQVGGVLVERTVAEALSSNFAFVIIILDWFSLSACMLDAAICKMRHVFTASRYAFWFQQVPLCALLLDALCFCQPSIPSTSILKVRPAVEQNQQKIKQDFWHVSYAKQRITSICEVLSACVWLFRIRSLAVH